MILFIASGQRNGAGFEPVVRGQIQQAGVELDGVATTPQDCRTQIVVQENSGYATPGFKRGGMPVQKGFRARIEIEAQEDLAAPAQHQHESHQRTLGPAGLQVPKMSPIHLALLTGQGVKTQIRLGGFAWTQAGDMRTELARPTAITTLLRHHQQAGGGKPREFLQLLKDHRMIGVDNRGPLTPLGLGQARLRQHPVHGAVMDPQLLGNGVHPPVLHEVIAKNIPVPFLVFGHAWSPVMAPYSGQLTG